MEKLLKEVYEQSLIGWDLVNDFDKYNIVELKELQEQASYFEGSLIGFIQRLTTILYNNLPTIQVDTTKLKHNTEGRLNKEDQKKLRQLEDYLNNSLEYIPIKYFNNNKKIYKWLKKDINFMLEYNIPFIEKSFLDMIDFNVVVSSTL